MRSHAIGLLFLAGSLFAQEEKDPFGHSRHGSEFDEGPRQAAYLMPGLGDQVDFPVAGLSPEGQAFFNQAVTQQHGFWYYEAERSFRQVAKFHPECAMAYWGMAVANIDLPERAVGFIANAVERSAGIPKREQLYIDAWAAYFGVDDKAREELQSGDEQRVAKAKLQLTEKITQADEEMDRGKRQAAKQKREKQLIKDLGTLVYEFPGDIEAKAFLAIQNWHANAWGGGVEIVSHTAIDALLDQVLAAKPRHPAHHYRIHLWDREDARRSLKSASLIGFSAPAIAHQWHMAGHIYAKLHRHAEAAWQQEASSRADHAHMQRDRVMPFEIHNYGHNQEWTVRSLSHIGRWREALALAKNMAEQPRHPTKNKPEDRRGIAGFARQRLTSVCVDHELWEEAVDICRNGFFDGDDVHGEAERLSLLGRALFRLGRRDEADRVVVGAAELLARARAERAEKIDTAEDEAIAEDKNSRETDDAIGTAGKDGTALVRRVLDLQRELKAERLLADGDAKAAIAEFEKISRFSKILLADAHVAAGAADKAIEILAKEVETNPGRLPTLQRLIAAHRAAAEPDTDRVAELEAQVASIPSSMAEFGDDFGERPAIETLGPFRWSPQPAPELELPIAGGGGFRLAGGEPTLVVFYLGFGCLHCIEQLQAIGPEAAEFAEIGIRIVAVGTDTADAAAASLAALPPDERFPFPLLADPGMSAFKIWRCYDDFEGMPLHGTFLIDGDGRVRWQDVSFEPFTEIDWLLAESRRLLRLPAATGSR